MHCRNLVVLLMQQALGCRVMVRALYEPLGVQDAGYYKSRTSKGMVVVTAPFFMRTTLPWRVAMASLCSMSSSPAGEHTLYEK